MKVICDVHIPLKLVSFLNKQEILAEHVNNLPDTFYSTDKVIADYADKNQLAVITKDIDFRNSYFLRKSPQRLIRICLGNISTSQLISIFEMNIVFLKDIYARFNQFYLEINEQGVITLST